MRQVLDQCARVVSIAMRWVAAHCTYPADAQSLLTDHPGEIVPLRAGQYVGPFDERISTLMTRRRIQDTLENGAFSAYNARPLHDS
jgi:hypothetical protein